MRLLRVASVISLNLFAMTGAQPALSKDLTADAVNAAAFSPRALKSSSRTPLMVKLQLLLDRAQFSPGLIDGRRGSNVSRALTAYKGERGLKANGQLDDKVWQMLTDADSEPVLEDYTLTKDDVAGPFVDKIPFDLEAMAKLDKLAYSGPAELLAERFHISEDLLKALNPDAALTAAGTKLVVPKLLKQRENVKIARIEVNKKEKAVRAFDKDGKIVSFYPATIGSRDNPAPSGTYKVRAIAENPAYYYDPADLSFKGVETRESLKIAPGPNNPVGSVWIDLTKETYGIHGTPDPASIGKTSSHGCVRLTNWDAKSLSKMVSKGTVVEFKD
jgi:lipoprotein-anchoring transpeptidase ErfK/SrfK